VCKAVCSLFIVNFPYKLSKKKKTLKFWTHTHILNININVRRHKLLDTL